MYDLSKVSMMDMMTAKSIDISAEPMMSKMFKAE